MDLAKKLRDEMAAKGVTVQQLANQTGVSYQRLWNKLNGRTVLTAEDAETIAKALSIDVPASQASATPAPSREAPARSTPAERAQPRQPAPNDVSREVRGRMDARGKTFAIVVSRWNELVTKELLEGCLDELRRYGEPATRVVHVPGTWEMPVAIRGLLLGARRPDAVIALGCIMQGQTAHAGLLGGDVGSALMSLQVEFGVPIAWGVLTPDNQDQALDRAGMKLGNKGREAAQAAIEMASLLADLTK